MDLSHIENRIDSELTPNLVYNSGANWRRLHDMAYAGYQLDAGNLPNQHKQTPVVITGSGPSLDEIMPHLHKWDGHIIIGASQSRIMAAHGIVPTYICAMDTHPQVADQLVIDHNISSSILVTHQCIDKSVLDRWTGHVRLLRLEVPGADMEHLHPWLSTRFTPHGCTINAELQLAIMLGYNPIYLAGCDYGTTDPLRWRAIDYVSRGPLTWVKSLEWTGVDDPIDLDDLRHTTAEMLYYRMLMLAIVKLRHPDIYVIGDGGTIMELPRVSVDNWIHHKTQSDGMLWRVIDDKIDATTREYGVYADRDANRIVKEWKR